MTWINRYMMARYKEGGRGPWEWDCWGLVRHIRHEHFGLRLLASFGDIRKTDARKCTRAYESEISIMEECSPEPGAIAGVLHGALCTHVAVVVEVDGRMSALEINHKTGVRRLSIPEFERVYLKVKYYRDRDISVPT